MLSQVSSAFTLTVEAVIFIPCWGGCSRRYLMFLLVSFAQSLWRCPRRKETYQPFQPQQCGDLFWLSLMPHLSLALNMFVRNSFTQDFRQLLQYQLYKVDFKWSPWPSSHTTSVLSSKDESCFDGRWKGADRSTTIIYFQLLWLYNAVLLVMMDLNLSKLDCPSQQSKQ